MVKRITKYLFSLLGLEIRNTSFPRFNKLRDFGIPLDEWEPRQKMFFLKLINLAVADLESPILLGYENAKRIAQKGGGRFHYDDQQQLRLSIQGVNFFINYTDELYVINEVFINEDYNFKTNDEVVVIDIGQNIGATSLFFATHNNVKRVYGYELFPQTYLAGQRNLSLNDASKIISKNLGLGRETRQLRVPYSLANKAVMGISSFEKFPGAVEVEVSVKDVAEEMIDLSQLEYGLKKICKMDCEGAEFEILDQLFKKNVVGLIDVYLIEWHFGDTQDIEMRFLQSGFDVVKSTSNNLVTGLIYAIKRQPGVL